MGMREKRIFRTPKHGGLEKALIFRKVGLVLLAI